MYKQIALAFIVGAAIGYFAMPRKEITKTVEVQVDRVVTVIKRPDGTVEEVTTDRSRTTTNEKLKLNANRPRHSLSVLGGTNFTDMHLGLHMTKEFIGPITLGAYALTNRTFGLSVGLNF